MAGRQPLGIEIVEQLMKQKGFSRCGSPALPAQNVSIDTISDKSSPSPHRRRETLCESAKWRRDLKKW
jgi:hypothetical protein